MAVAGIATITGGYFIFRYMKIKSAYEKTLSESQAESVLQSSLKDIDESIIDNASEDDTSALPRGNTDTSIEDGSLEDGSLETDTQLLNEFEILTGMGDY